MTDTKDILALTRQSHPAGPILLCVAGELDHYTGPRLSEAIDELPFGPGTDVVIDLSALEYCDSTGLSLLITAHHRAEAAGSSLSFAGPSPELARVFAIVGLDQVFTLHASVERAVEALVR